MHTITNYQYHVAGRRWIFLLNSATPKELINASLYDEENPKLYLIREPFTNEVNDRFTLLGDGDLVTMVDDILQEIAYKIIQNISTFQTYIIPSIDFSAGFELIRNDN